MAAIVFPPHSLPRPTGRRSAFPTPGFSTPTRTRRPGVVDRSCPVRAGVSAEIYRRRRVGVVVGAMTTLAIAYFLVVALSTRVGAMTTVANPTWKTASAPAAAVVSATPPLTYTVRPGDTLWSIARRLQPTGDIRPLVDLLAERSGGAALQVGQRLTLSDLGSDLVLDGLGGLGR